MAHVSYWDSLIRVLVCVGLSACIGAEREFRREPAGFRTHVLLGLGATLFTLGGMVAVSGSDPTRVAAQIVSGIGFLGGGAILRDTGRVTGVTTAASLWVTAAIGMSTGFGHLGLAATVTAVALLALLALRAVDATVFPRLRGREIVVMINDSTSITETVELLGQAIGRVKLIRVYATTPGVQRLVVQTFNDEHDIGSFAESVRILPGVTGIDVRA